ncbi:hypothetical protein [Amycolatopsis lurida]|nr:hypothetical protein [Amycolatopsis lurida]
MIIWDIGTSDPAWWTRLDDLPGGDVIEFVEIEQEPTFSDVDDNN